MQFDKGFDQRQAKAGLFIFAVEVAVDLLEGVGIRSRGISPNFGLESRGDLLFSAAIPPNRAMSLSLLKFVGQASLVDEAMPPS